MTRVCFVTGKRGGFEAMLPTLKAIEASNKLELRVIATDQHLKPEFGRTIDVVRKKMRVDYTIDGWQRGDTNEQRAAALGRILGDLPRALGRLQPDILLVIGDRGESLVAAIAAHNQRIAIAHVQGGDLSGGVDDAQRHAITKLAHIHFVSTENSAKRVAGLGELPGQIHTVGDPHIDQISLGQYTDIKPVMNRYKIPFDRPFLMVLHHPDTLQTAEQNEEDILQIMMAVTQAGFRTIMVYPCTDQHHGVIIKRLEKTAAEFPQVSVHPNIPAQDWLGLLSITGCLIGNSSSGIIEAPYFGTQVINLGGRQNCREGTNRSDNIDPFDAGVIHSAIKSAIAIGRKPATHPFGNGTAYKQIVEVLEGVRVDAELLNKRMTY